MYSIGNENTAFLQCFLYEYIEVEFAENPHTRPRLIFQSSLEDCAHRLLAKTWSGTYFVMTGTGLYYQCRAIETIHVRVC